MTLTGSLAAAEPRERLQTQLTALFRPLLAEPVPVRVVCLYSQTDSSKAFVLVERFPLGPEAAEGKAAEGQTSACPTAGRGARAAAKNPPPIRSPTCWRC